MKRAFSADDLLLRLPGALPQASGDTAPLALNTYKERRTKIIAVIFHTRSVIKPGELPRNFAAGGAQSPAWVNSRAGW